MIYLDYNATTPINKEVTEAMLPFIYENYGNPSSATNWVWMLKMFKYHPQGTCASEINFEIENGIVKNVHFTDGCPGNLEAICKLVEGMPVEEVTKRLRGIVCQNGTSCADQLVTALEETVSKQLVQNRQG